MEGPKDEQSILEDTPQNEADYSGESFDDIQGRKYVPTVKVGESSDWLTVIDLVRREPTNREKDGEKYNDALKPRDHKEGDKLWAYYLITDKGEYNK